METTETTTKSKKRRFGRPGRPRAAVPYETFSFTLSKEIFDELTRRAKVERVALSEIVSRGVRRYFGICGDGVPLSAPLRRKLEQIAAIVDEEDRLS